MKAYAFKAALYCEDCARQIMTGLQQPAPPFNVDSDSYPQGPLALGGGEADTPQHCDSCNVFLCNPLTPDGDSYVRDKAEGFTRPGDSWEDVATRAANSAQHDLAGWIRYYLAPGQ